LDLLPSLFNTKAQIYIKTVNDKAINWTVFLDPFSRNLWLLVLLVAMVISLLLTFIEIFFDLTKDKFWFVIYLKNLWISMKANAGGKPSSVKKNESYRIVLFVCLFIGAIVWIAFRASFTSELAVIKLKLPFNDLESLYQSNFR